MQTAKFSGLFDSIVNAVTTVLPFVVGNAQGNTPRFDMFGAIDQLTIQRFELEATYRNLSNAQKVEQGQRAIEIANQIIQAFNSLPPCRETACDYLATEKGHAQTALTNIQKMYQEAQQFASTNPSGNTATGNNTGNNQTPIIIQDSSNQQLLLYGGIGLAILILLKK